MNRSQALLDTDILSAIMRREAFAVEQARAYLAVHPKLSISLFTRYEILRGLKAKNATAQLKRFDVLCQSLQILPVTDAIIVRAADIYAHLYGRGQLIGDADIVIAATALEHGMVLATNNIKHHSHIQGLVLENWLYTPWSFDTRNPQRSCLGATPEAPDDSAKARLGFSKRAFPSLNSGAHYDSNP